MKDDDKDDKGRKSTDADGDLIGRKRQRWDDDNGDSDNGSAKVTDTEDFRKLSVKELRQEAKLRGFSTTLSKKELIERLSSDADADKKDDDGGNLEGLLVYFPDTEKKTQKKKGFLSCTYLWCHNFDDGWQRKTKVRRRNK
ncbi:hypothetical protein ACH5RR_020020 [Cinchona calisaya]|uniref:SAP domain-containing protein n=1 Tax=Cinchona calisaya TaxID=153742 RepID=A0ABD2ZD88_9GENT